MINDGIFTVIYMFFWIMILILPIFICYNQAKKKNRNALGWGILGFLFGWLSVIIIILVGTKTSNEEKMLDIKIKKEKLKQLKLLRKK